MKSIFKFFIILVLLGITNEISAQKVVPGYNYIPEFDQKAFTVINLTDTVKILYVTDTSIVAWKGSGPYDSLSLMDHLAVYKIENVTAFYHRKVGHVFQKAVFSGALGVVAGVLITSNATDGNNADNSKTQENAAVFGGGLGIGMGLLSGFANFQKYDWRVGDSIAFKLKKVRKYQSCHEIIPYHLYLAVTGK